MNYNKSCLRTWIKVLSFGSSYLKDLKKKTIEMVFMHEPWQLRGGPIMPCWSDESKTVDLPTLLEHVHMWTVLEFISLIICPQYSLLLHRNKFTVFIPCLWSFSFCLCFFLLYYQIHKSSNPCVHSL